MSDTDTVSELINLQKNSRINIADLENILVDNSTSQNVPIDTKGINYGGEAYDDYRRPGSFLTQSTLKEYLDFVLSESYRLMGQGPSENLMQNFLSRLDRHGTAIIPLNTMNYGYTFITRPRLNLTGANLVQNPVLNTLLANDPNSVAFMIRALLDTRMATGQPLFRGTNASYNGYTQEATEFLDAVDKSGLVDRYNPFFVPLCNGLKGMSGFPDFTLETETTEGDFHSGDFTFAKGSDMLNRSQEFSLEFRDVNGSIILSCIYYWLIYIALQCKGVTMAYPDDIYEQRLNYTVSIYRFITDPTRRYVLWWAKATGCFPKSAPVGALFNVNQGEVTISAAGNFSIPFSVNKVEVNDPGILLDFNTLMKRYLPCIESMPNADDSLNTPTAGLNYCGLPYVISDNTNGIQLIWKTSPSYLETTGVNSIVDDIVDNTTKWNEVIEQVQSKRNQELQSILNSMNVSDTVNDDTTALV